MSNALSNEFEAEWEKAGARNSALTIYRSRLNGKIVVGLTKPNGSWNALALNDDDAAEVRDTLNNILGRVL